MKRVEIDLSGLSSLYEEAVQQISDVFDEISREESNKQEEVSKNPLIDVCTLDQYLYIDVATPGYERESLEVSVEDSMIIVSGKSEEVDGLKYYQKDIVSGDFERVIAVDTDTYDIESITVMYENGILTIVLKTLEEKTPYRKTVEIQ